MAGQHHRPSMSITLPPGFQFHYTDGQLPQTPIQQEEPQAPVNPPPPPRPNTFKVRRRRTTMPDFQDQEQEPASSDTIIPTIEMSEAASEISSPVMQPSPSSHGLLAPLPPSIQRLVTPPKTPASRTGFAPSIESPTDEWAMINDSRDALRPAFDRAGSIASSFSDSSVSSCGSSDFSAPHHGSCMSPGSEGTDPFMDDDLSRANERPVISPRAHGDSPVAKRVKTNQHIKWTPAMDEHLWMTYMQYITDPRVTPFKMLPGTCPPLGLCSRVASKARRTWSSYRASSPGVETNQMTDHVSREGTPDTIRPEAKESKQPQWPRSDAATRKRLRTLCKKKPSLSAHYQRLLRTRSPSPFHSSSTMGTNSDAAPPAPSAFSSGDMKTSLVTSTAPSMQPDGPLAQLSSDATPAHQPRPKSQRANRPADWFARIPRSQAHQKSLSLQSGLNLHTNTNTNTAGQLASPFDDAATKSHLLQSMGTTKSLGRNTFNQDGKGPSLASPFEVSGAPTAPRTSLKRRFKPDEDKPKRAGLQDVFGSSEGGVGIVRNRGFTVGAARATDNLSKMFTTPTSVDNQMSEAPTAPATAGIGGQGFHSVPRRLAEPVPRLGSPFIEASNKQFNTFPRSYIPSPSNPTPFQSRLRELAGNNYFTSSNSSDDPF
ncbi:hypothetical protein KC355_g6860 [Hortaea werneckii]|nr:hypothetical protein KC355_g6860 [Hortaea werneckii]